MFALVDCNNFYVSCERAFQPKLKKRGVVVLSNNDGCIISRSNEVKALGIPMGEAYFSCKKLLEQHHVAVRSSNYTLYGDLSHRVMEILRALAPDIEVYSIDEAFVSLKAVRESELEVFGRLMSKKVYQCTGIPVSIGIGQTKTLAKAAQKLAKTHPEFSKTGVASLHGRTDIDALLDHVDVKDIWGVGRQYTKLLRAHNIQTARDLKYANTNWVKQHMTIMGKRMVLELRGIECFPLEQIPKAKKMIASTRMFGPSISTKNQLSEAIATYATRASEKLRRQHSIASLVHLFIMTNRYREDQPQYICNTTVALPIPTAHTPLIIQYALLGLDAIFRSGYEYKKAGVMLSGIVPESKPQQHLFIRNFQEEKFKNAMRAVDQINKSWGRDTIQSAAAGIKKPWKMYQRAKSPRYTTSWEELPIATTD